MLGINSARNLRPWTEIATVAEFIPSVSEGPARNDGVSLIRNRSTSIRHPDLRFSNGQIYVSP